MFWLKNYQNANELKPQTEQFHPIIEILQEKKGKKNHKRDHTKTTLHYYI